jgi:hypothetical protein
MLQAAIFIVNECPIGHRNDLSRIDQVEVSLDLNEKGMFLGYSV